VNNINDMALFFTRNNDICSVEGWWHPENKIISNIIYLNDESGNCKICDKKYIKLTRKNNGEWRSFEEQSHIVNKARSLEDAYFIHNKKIIDKKDILYFIDPFNTYLKFKQQRPEKYKLLKEIFSILNVSEKENSVGIVGSYQIGRYNRDSDIDVMFKYNLKTNLKIFENIKNISKKYPVRDRGRKLPLRFLYKNTVFCCHFAYENADECFKGFSTNYFEKNYRGNVEVTDITHSIYTPTVLRVKNAIDENLWLVIYHGGEKGEFRIGDRLHIEGQFIENKKIKYINTVKTKRL